MPNDEKLVARIVFKARLGDGPVQVVGDADVYEYDLNGGSLEEFLQNGGSDWAYEAVHSDTLRYWAEVAPSSGSANA